MPKASQIIPLLVYGIYLACTGVARLLPLKLVFLAGQWLGWAGYFILWRRRAVAVRNLMLALDKTEDEARTIARQHFMNLGANMFSALKIATMSDEEIFKHVTVDMPPEVEVYTKGKGAEKCGVAMISHMGNWEIFSHMAPILPGYKCGAIYHKLANDHVDRHFRESRARSGVTLFDRREGYLKCVEFLRNGGVVGVLVDQYAGLPGTWMPFFRRLTSTSTLAATLAQRAGAPIFPISVNTVGLARWRVIASLPIESKGDVEVLTARINLELEKQISASPADWLWSHNRWKTPRWVFLFTRSGRRVFYPPGFDMATLIPYRILVRAADGMEEANASLPAVRAIKSGRPDAHVTVVADAAQAEFWKGIAEVDAVLGVGPEESAGDVGRRIKNLGSFDVGILLSPARRAAMEVWLGGVPYRVGPPYRFWLNEWKNSPGLGDPPERGAERYGRIADGVGARVV